MADDNSGAETSSWGNWVSTLATIAAPTTFIGALLLYFGFAYTDALYGYFGVDAATLGFSTQDYALRSAGALYVPAGTALTVALAGVLMYYAVCALGNRTAPLPSRVQLFPHVLSACGLILFLLGMLGGFRVWRAGAMDTPLLLGGGLVLLMYGRVLSFKLVGADYPVARERLALALVVALVALSSFWAAHVYAKNHGFHDAEYLADHLRLRPAVTIDTTERLYFNHQQVRETILPAAAPNQEFRYRYDGLRLLAEANSRMFIIPQNWAVTDGSVLVLPTDRRIRVTFRPG